MNDLNSSTKCVCLCGNQTFEVVFEYSEPPAGEVRFAFDKGSYHRTVQRCSHCGHYLSVHSMDMNELYNRQYVDSTYGPGGLERTFEKIVALDPSRSDNAGRVEFIIGFVETRYGGGGRKRGDFDILDVGSGLCVFLDRIKKQTHWRCTALDPDDRAVDHARSRVGVAGIAGDFMSISDLGSFDLIAFNKVLEHVRDPIGMLRKARRHLKAEGTVYIELPDGEMAANEGPGREEFFVDHHHVFSLKSLKILVERAGFSIVALERLREPSSKFTLRAFLQ